MPWKTMGIFVVFIFLFTFHFKGEAQRAISGPLLFTAPASDGVSLDGTYVFAVDASGLPNVATVEFDIGALRLGVVQTAPYQLRWNTGYGKDGNYAVQAIARDAFGKIIATSEREFNIDNAEVTMYVSSPDLSQVLQGTVHFLVPANDPTNYPVIFHLFVDGQEAGYWDSSALTHERTAFFDLDTTRFANGRHELAIALNGAKETAAPHTYTNYSAMLDRMITINNGHAVMEIVATYQNVYLKPSQTILLSCRRLFADKTSGACAAPAYSSDDPAVAQVSRSGLVTANSKGFASIVVGDSGKTTKVYVWVKNSFNIPHFSGSGDFLNSYDTQRSIFPVAPVVLDPAYLRSDASLLAETKRAAFNTLAFGFYLNTRNLSTSYAGWKSTQDAILTSRIQWAKDNGFHIIATGDDAFRRPGDDAWWTLNWRNGKQAAQYAMTTLAKSGIGISVEMVDEAAMLYGWYPVSPSKVGQPGLPGQPGSFQSVVCSGITCTVNWPNHGYRDDRWTAFQGSIHPELNTLAGQPFIVQHATQNTFDFVPNAPITATLTSTNDPNLEIMLFAAWPCNAGARDGLNHPCDPFTPNDAVQIFSGWLRGASPRVPFNWPALGLLKPAVHANWVGQAAIDQGISDYASHYWDALSGSRTYSWSNGVQQRIFWMKDAFYARQPYMAQDRPQLMLVCGSSFAYTKQSSDTSYYNPPVDTLDQPGCDGPVATAEIMTAAALGNAGVRQYQFDMNTPSQRAAYPVGTILQTGMRPDATERTSREIWQATGYASNLLTKVLQPYILGTAANSPGYQSNIVTAVRHGNDATMLMIVNGNDADRTVSVDFKPYKSGTEITRYRLSYSYLWSDLLPDGDGETITLPRGGSVVYLFPFAPATKFLQPAGLLPTFPAGARRASVSYDYIYNEHLAQITEAADCTRGCTLHVDPRLGSIYYQFTYADENGKVINRSNTASLAPH